MRITKRLAGALGAGALSVLLVGSMATAAVPAAETSAITEGRGGAAKLEAVLGRLVEEGRITAAQRDAILERVRQSASRDKRGGEQAEKKRPAHSAKALRGAFLATAASHLGMTVDEVRESLRGGKSLAALAVEKGKTRDSLIAALTAAAGQRIDAAASAGKITADQATTMKAKIGEHVAKAVDKVHDKSEKKKDRKKDRPGRP